MVTCAKDSRDGGAGLPKTTEAQMIPSKSVGAEHDLQGLMFAEFRSCFALISPFHPPIPEIEHVTVSSMLLCIGCM